MKAFEFVEPKTGNDGIQECITADHYFDGRHYANDIAAREIAWAIRAISHCLTLGEALDFLHKQEDMLTRAAADDQAMALKWRKRRAALEAQAEGGAK